MKSLPSCLLALSLAACATDPSYAPGAPPAPIVRSLTGAAPPPAPAEGFSFLVGSHMYGNPGTLAAIPSETLIAKLLPLRNGSEQFIVSTGDFIRSFDSLMIVPTIEMLNFLEKPMFNAPGNHDYRAGEYEEFFGPSFGCFRHGNVLFVLLNTEIDPWDFTQPQIDMVARVGDWVVQQDDIDHVFYFAHKLVFAIDEPRYAAVLRNCNGSDGLDGKSNFKASVLPAVRRVAKQKNVLWFGGDFGVSWSFSLFYDRHPDYGITFLGCGLGSTRRDCMLRLNVKGKSVDVEAVPMSEGAVLDQGEPIQGPVERYGPEFWRQHFAAKK